MKFELLPFEKVFADESGGNLKTLRSEYKDYGKYPVVDQGQELLGGFVDDASRICGNGRSAIVFGDHTRCFKFIDFPFCMGADGVKVLRPKIDADLKYLYYFLKSLNLPEAGYSRHYKFLKRMEIIIPPLAEQRRIAAILDQVESLRARRQESLVQLDTLAKAIFIEMFGDPLTNPKGWSEATLGDLIISASDGPHVSPQYAETGIPFLSTRHVRPGEINWDDLKYISAKDAQTQWKKCKPQRGDILYTKGGTTGLAAAVKTDEEFAVWVHVALLKPKTKIVHPVWLESMLNSYYCYRQSQDFTRGIANRDLGLTRMVKIRMYSPPLDLQCEFARRIEKRDQLKQTIHKTRAALEELFKTLQYRAFLGEL